MAMKKGEQVIKKRKSGPLSVEGASRKPGPVVRVVQVFAPVIVKADKSNFCSLVQKLTGKQSTVASQEPSPPPPLSLSSSSSSLEEEDDHELMNIIQPAYIKNNLTSALSCTSSDLSAHMMNDRHTYQYHSDHFSFSSINDTPLSPPTYTSSAGFSYHAAESDDHINSDDTPFFDYFDYHHLIDLPALPQVLDQEDERWLECSFSNTFLDQN